MKRYSLLVLTLALLVCVSSAFAIFPGPRPGVIGDGTVQVQLLHGWWSPIPVAPLGTPTPAWYSCFATNNIRVAQTEGLTLSQKLTNVPLTSAPVMYVVTNFNNNGPVFSASPHPLGVATYSGLWTVVYVTWLPGSTPHVITNAFPENPVTNPTGLPPVTAAIYTTSIGGTPLVPVVAPFPPLTLVGPFTIMDCPIFATGPVSSPWLKPTNLLFPYTYRIPQGSFFNAYNKLLTIPFWNVYCRDDITRRISVDRVVIPDTSDLFIASQIKANLAPTLALVPWIAPQPSPLGGKSTMFVINWLQDIDPGPGVQILKVLINQYPVLDACPTSCSWRNTNRNYSPVDAFVLLNRNLLLISPEVLFNNWEFVVQNILSGRLVPVPPYVYPPLAVGPAVNAPVLCSRAQ